MQASCSDLPSARMITALSPMRCILGVDRDHASSPSSGAVVTGSGRHTAVLSLRAGVGCKLSGATIMAKITAPLTKP